MPQKNICPLNGRPLIAYTIEAAMAARGLEAVMVSTDSEEVAQVAREAGGWVPLLRPSDLAGDDTPTWQVLRHAVEFYEGQTGSRVHSVVTLQPTTPLRQARDIEEALDLYLRHQPEADSLVSACVVEHMHPLTLYRPDGPYAKPFLPGEVHTRRRQEWDTVVWRNGAVYISRRELVMVEGAVVGQRPLFYEMPVHRSVSIDTLYDLRLAELHMIHAHWLGGGAERAVEAPWDALGRPRR